MKAYQPVRIRQAGFTLIELMITLAIVGILVAVAYPSYTSYIVKGKRAECRGALFQSMQQQERYFSQYNTYVAFAEAATSAVTKSFSADSAANSACLITATTCADVSGSTTAQCIELQGRMVKTTNGIGYLYMDSSGNKGCTVSGSRVNTNTTANTNCWP